MRDLISRQAAIDALNRHLDTIPVVNNNTMETIRRSEVMDCREIINGLPSAEVRTYMSSANDTISRQAAIDTLSQYPFEKVVNCISIIEELPSAQPERLTDDDFETIRIHLNAYKESLCNQHRWEEAEEYQRIIDRFMAFASAQPEIIYSKDYCVKHNKGHGYYLDGTVIGIKDCCPLVEIRGFAQGHEFDYQYCAYAERRTDE